MRWRGDGSKPLSRANIRDAIHSYAAICPGLASTPFDCVVAILNIAHERREFAVRTVASARILDHYGIALLCCADRVKKLPASSALVVGGTLEQYRVLPR